MSPACSLEDMSWPLDQLAECIPALLRCSGLGDAQTPDIPRIAASADVPSSVQRTAKLFGCEADTIAASYRELEQELRGCFPAILQAGDRYFAVVRERRGSMRLLCPDLEMRQLSVAIVCAEIRRPAEGDRRGKVEEVLGRCGIRGQRLARAADLLAVSELGSQAVCQGWLFRESCGVPVARWLRQVQAVRQAVLLVVSHAAAYALWLLSWALLGGLSLAGHMDRGWVFGWSLLIASFVACRVLGSWLQSRIAIGVGGLLKRRLLEGVLRLDPAEIKHQGIGSFLGKTFEADAIETLALGGGIASVLATVDLLFSGLVLGRLAILLAAWFGLALFLSWRFLGRYEKWTSNRLSLTQDLVESMVGHRTRLAQLPPERWHEAEDQALENYYGRSWDVDRLGSILLTCIPRGWLVLGLICGAQSIVAGVAPPTQTAVLLGGILLAWAAFERLVGSLSEVAAACVTWKRIGYLFQAASRPELLGSIAGIGPVADSDQGNLMDVDHLTFRYRPNGAPVLNGCSLSIQKGDHILLEGPSGGGKTTLASLLAGARSPESGLVLAGGLDRQTLGSDGWRKRVTLVPQYHENHIFTETLAFNLLCGRTWPPSSADLEETQEVCRGLGLGDVLDRMPNGLLQMVGEGGWQLSHGERSRLFVARALLQKPSLMILDESFGALDPENLTLALEFTLDRAESLIVIAHP